MNLFPFLTREDACTLRVAHPDVSIRLFANHHVVVERDAFDQLFEFADLSRAVSEVQDRDPAFFGGPASLDQIVLTPDFHKGSGVPVGTVALARNFVVPQAVGNDVCCGMRLLATDLPVELLEGHWEKIKLRLRAIFFAGERNIPMSPRQRKALLRYGLPGLLETASDNTSGAWTKFDAKAQADDLSRVHGGGQIPTRRLFGFEGFIESSGRSDGRDPQIGCVGGGNHFVEIQRIDSLLDGHLARNWGLIKGNAALMIHSGSVGLGYAIGGHFMDRARELFPSKVKAPKGGFYPLPIIGPRAEEGLFYLDGMGNAANFAFANRLFLGLMALRAIEEATGHTISSKLIYDAPHNLVFRDGENCLHRKGATPAHGPDRTNPAEWEGKPVIIPGSMGSASYLLVGQENTTALSSACHGAGRSLSRGRAAHSQDGDKEIERLRVVTPIDPNAPHIRGRTDIVEKHRQRLLEERPSAYKAIEPVIDTIHEARIASKVARLLPLLTVKG